VRLKQRQSQRQRQIVHFISISLFSLILFFSSDQTEQMKDEFLKLFPTDRVWGSDELLVDPLVIKRRGSTDILNPRRMKTMITSSPEDCEKKFRLRFDLNGFDHKSVRVSADSDRITVRALKLDDPIGGGEMVQKDLGTETVVASSANGGATAGAAGVGTTSSSSGSSFSSAAKEYCRKIEKPRDVDHNKLKSRISSDGILLIQASLTSSSRRTSKSGSITRKTNIGPSPSHSFQVRVY